MEAGTGHAHERGAREYLREYLREYGWEYGWEWEPRPRGDAALDESLLPSGR